MNDDARDARPRERAKLWRDAALGNLELLRARFVTQTFSPHTHETYAIGVVESGADYFDYRGQREVAGAGAIGIVHPGEWHTGGPYSATGWRYRAFYPDVNIMRRALASLGAKLCDLPFFREPVINDPELAAQFMRTHAASETHATELERESRLIWALAQLIQRYADLSLAMQPVQPASAQVTTLIDYLHDNLALNIRLADLARLARLSEFQVLRVFRAATRLPPHAYLNQLRVERAKQLLFEDKPLADVAAQTGFSDQAHLTRRFKCLTGVTPGAVIAQSRAR